MTKQENMEKDLAQAKQMDDNLSNFQYEAIERVKQKMLVESCEGYVVPVVSKAKNQPLYHNYD